jgi:hypothetical protein
MIMSIEIRPYKVLTIILSHLLQTGDRSIDPGIINAGIISRTEKPIRILGFAGPSGVSKFIIASKDPGVIRLK